jgi:general L-amino acid transport system permease protein
MATTSPNLIKETKIPFWRDVRLLGVFGQLIFIVLVLTGLGWLIGNFIENSRIQGLQLGFDFLNVTAAFDIAEGIAYSATDTFGRAIWVGMVNTIRVSVLGIILTTLVGLITGIARLSDNWLISKIATIYIETVRNIPLLVQLFFIYFGVILKLPPVQESLQPFGWPVYLSQRGINIPGLTPTVSFSVWLAFVVLAVALVIALWLVQSQQEEKTGHPSNKMTTAVIVFLMVVIIGWLVTTNLNSNQAMLTASSRNIQSFEDFEKIYLVKVDEDALKELEVGPATIDSLKSVEDVADYTTELNQRLRTLQKQAAAASLAKIEATAAQAAGISSPAEPASTAEVVTGPNIESIEAEIDQLKEQLDVFTAAAIVICTVEDSVAEINAIGEFYRLNIPAEVESEKTMTEAGEKFADGKCDLLVGTQAELAGERAVLKKPEDYATTPVGVSPLILNIPVLAGFNIQGGVKLTPEFAALLAGLVIYTGAFAAEIVRAGILAVSKGQSEAARALGLSEYQRLRLIVLPQASRVIIPPMTNQYLNLTKNSSLAVAIGFPDLVAIGNTVLNQSGYAVQVVLIFMLSYLSISLAISAFLNWYNKKVALVER